MCSYTLLCIFLWLHQHSSSGWCIDCRQMGTIQPQHQQEYQHQQHKENNIQPQQFHICPSKSKEMLTWIRSLNCFWTLHLPAESPITAHRVATWWKISRKFFKMAPYLPLLPPLPLPTPRPLLPPPLIPCIFVFVCLPFPPVDNPTSSWHQSSLNCCAVTPNPSPPPSPVHPRNGAWEQCPLERGKHTGRMQCNATHIGTQADRELQPRCIPPLPMSVQCHARCTKSCGCRWAALSRAAESKPALSNCAAWRGAEKAQSAKQIAHFLQSVCWCVIRGIVNVCEIECSWRTQHCKVRFAEWSSLPPCLNSHVLVQLV